MNMLAQDKDISEFGALEALNKVGKKIAAGEDLDFYEQCVVMVVSASMASDAGHRATREYFIKQQENQPIPMHPIMNKFIDAFPTNKTLSMAEFGLIATGIDPKTGSSIYPSDNKPKIEKTYIVKKRGTNEIKIGKTVDVEFRVKTLQNQSGCKLDILCVIEKNIENMLHKQFAEFRTVGEWFDDSKGLIAAFAAKQGGAA